MEFTKILPPRREAPAGSKEDGGKNEPFEEEPSGCAELEEKAGWGLVSPGGGFLTALDAIFTQPAETGGRGK